MFRATPLRSRLTCCPPKASFHSKLAIVASVLMSVSIAACTDRRYRIYNLGLSGFIGIDQSVYGPPRTFGASFAYWWGK
jgi:hypothetical protein